MAATNPPTSKTPDFNIPWMERWRAVDFSWAGLAKKQPWQPDQATSLQDYLRRLERDASDDELLRQGVLIDCGDAGIHHALYVPDEWATSGLAKTTPENLERRKQHQWNKVFTDGGLREHSRGAISGVHAPDEIAERLVSSFQVSFDWVRFRSELRHLPKRGDRSFTWCMFEKDVEFYGASGAEDFRSSVHFTWCEFTKKISMAQCSGLVLLDVNGSCLREGIQISDSELQKCRFDDCQIKSIMIDDSVVRRRLTVASSTVSFIEWINATFDDHVLFVELAVEKSLGLLACDFRSRVTFSSMTWPKSTYMAASSSGSKFDGIVAVEGGEPPPAQLFQDADFKSRVAFNLFSDRERKLAFKTN